MAKKSGSGKIPNGKPQRSSVIRTKEHWKSEPDEHDYPAAAAYLELLVGPAVAGALVDTLRSVELVHQHAKDILRASRLDLLPVDNVHVAKDLDRVRSGQKLSPVLLVRGDLAKGVALTIADGYHRVCASYHLDEDADIPCRLVDLTSRSRAARPSATGA